MSKHVQTTSQISRSGKFLVVKLKRDALNFSRKLVVGAAAGVSAVAIQAFLASYFDYQLDVATATVISGGVTWLAQSIATYLPAEVIEQEARTSSVDALD